MTQPVGQLAQALLQNPDLWTRALEDMRTRFPEALANRPQWAMAVSVVGKQIAVLIEQMPSQVREYLEQVAQEDSPPPTQPSENEVPLSVSVDLREALAAALRAQLPEAIKEGVKPLIDLDAEDQAIKGENRKLKGVLVYLSTETLGRFVRKAHWILNLQPNSNEPQLMHWAEVDRINGLIAQLIELREYRWGRQEGRELFNLVSEARRYCVQLERRHFIRTKDESTEQPRPIASGPAPLSPDNVVGNAPGAEKLAGVLAEAEDPEALAAEPDPNSGRTTRRASATGRGKSKKGDDDEKDGDSDSPSPRRRVSRARQVEPPPAVIPDLEDDDFDGLVGNGANGQKLQQLKAEIENGGENPDGSDE